METKPNTVGILVGGGPAPGINSVIGAATIRACLSGWKVLGLRDGFRWLMEGDTQAVRALAIEEVSRIHFRGGSFLGTSRANPTKSPELLQKTVASLRTLGINKLITIGGDDTLYSAHCVAEAAGDEIAVVHVPKTIDNDLDLPLMTSTFGFQTARHVGVEIVKNLMTDAQTTSRWYFIIAMGRKAGHLALGMGKAAGATITLIPEEFSEPQIKLAEVVDTLACAIVKRKAHGRADGVAVIAEGIMERMAPEDLRQLGEIERDPHGNIRFAEVEFGRILKARVEERMAQLKVKTTIVSKDVGYELRCADPIPFDMDYTRDLGYCAAQYLYDGGTRSLICTIEGSFSPIPFVQLMDPTTGKSRIRLVNIMSDRYRIGRRYMLRLRREDLTDPVELTRLAKTAGLGAEEFRAQFEYLVRHEPPNIALRGH